MLPLRRLAREALSDTVMISGLAFVEDELEAERVALCGQHYEHQAGRQALRSGHVPSSLVLGGRRVKVERPRARSVDGHELSLPSWRAWS
jgi:putative transposase